MRRVNRGERKVGLALALRRPVGMRRWRICRRTWAGVWQQRTDTGGSGRRPGSRRADRWPYVGRVALSSRSGFCAKSLTFSSP